MSDQRHRREAAQLSLRPAANSSIQILVREVFTNHGAWKVTP